ncbi:MAG: TetR-like C-terminal domain-containing protein [Roseiflexaceae bacterium]
MPPKAGLDHATVVQAAAALADTAGIGQLRLADLAARLGVRTPSLYNHIAGLPGLRRDLALLGTRELGARLSRAAIGKSGDTAIQAIAQAYRAFVIEHPGLYAATVRSGLLVDQPDPELNTAQQDAVDVVLMVLSAYQLSGTDAYHAVRGLRSVIHGFATLEASGGFGIPMDLDISFQQLIQIFIAGLRASSSQR